MGSDADSESRLVRGKLGAGGGHSDSSPQSWSLDKPTSPHVSGPLWGPGAPPRGLQVQEEEAGAGESPGPSLELQTLDGGAVRGHLCHLREIRFMEAQPSGGLS